MDLLLSALFDGWTGVVKIAITAPIMYFGVVIAIRIVGKRSTSQMNNFDWVVTVAIGALTASGIVSDSVTVLEALTAIATLLGSQYLLTKGVFAFDKVTKLVKSNPTLLVDNGRFVDEAMRQERVTKSEVMSALRGQGLINVEEAKWVILETNATFSVIPKSDRDFSNAEFEAVPAFQKPAK